MAISVAVFVGASKESLGPCDLVVIWKADCVAIQGTVQSLETHRTPPETSKKKTSSNHVHLQFCFKMFQQGGSRRSRRLQGNCASVRGMPRGLMWDH